MITRLEFEVLVREISARGFEDDIVWADSIEPPASADDFALEAAFVICNSGMKFEIASRIYTRVKAELLAGASAHGVFRHRGKAEAIDRIWGDRQELYLDYLIRGTVEDQLAFCESLPWIGPITKFHLAKNFGAQVAKPDVHLQRLADAEGTTPQSLCERLAAETGHRVPAVDTVLWRACAIGVLDSRAL